MSAPVERRHRELAFERFGQKPAISSDDRWIDSGHDAYLSYWLVVPRRVAQTLADFEADAAKRSPLSRLQQWAALDKDRVFDIRFIAAIAHPWAVELSNDSVSWSVVADCHDSFERAVDHALSQAAKEERR